ncbi:uncharacterized protein LAJ45_02566 [Morchella importuna]|uniref:uncharacterized protein n=1 Tax=Morchella importuna TaxID=1174673 RepID=UPI001E8EDD41|nr:uncharacterized protein LAJ45_02566 [Morchella importuna]KAH8153753.1 hypothetical protein LAJ45_02566 [Morchella importuna]
MRKALLLLKSEGLQAGRGEDGVFRVRQNMAGRGTGVAATSQQPPTLVVGDEIARRLAKTNVDRWLGAVFCLNTSTQGSPATVTRSNRSEVSSLPRSGTKRFLLFSGLQHNTM